MTQQQNALLTRLEEKIQALQYGYAAAKERLVRLEHENAQLHTASLSQQAEIEALKQENSLLRPLLPIQGRPQAQGMVDSLIAEIDRCIALLEK